MERLITDELIKRFLDEWLDAPRTTIVTYRQGLQRAQAMGIEIDNDCLAAFDRALAHTENNYTGRQGVYSVATRKIYTAALTRFVTWLDVMEMAPEGFSLAKVKARFKIGHNRTNASDSIPRLADPDLSQIVSFYQEAVEDPALTGQARLIALRNYALVQVLCSTGCRSCELRSLTRAMCADGKRAEFPIVGKGRHRRTLYLSDPACAAIQAYCQARDLISEGHDRNPALFISHAYRGNGKSIDHCTVHLIVKKAARALNLSENTSPHSFRHALASDLLNAGMPLDSIQVLLGHRSIVTTQSFYATLNSTRMREQLARYRRDMPEAGLGPNRGGA